MPTIHATEIDDNTPTEALEGILEEDPSSRERPLSEPCILEEEEPSLNEGPRSDPLARKYAGWKTYYLKSPFGLAWTGLFLSFAATIVGLQMLLTTMNRDASVSNASLHATGMTVESTKDYWLSTYSHLYTNSTVIPGSVQWKALNWLTTADPLAPLTPENRLVQRYALACLYFQWDGPQWLFSTAGAGWLDFVTQAAASPDGTVSILAAPVHEEGTPFAAEEEKVMTKAQVPFHECQWLGVTCNNQDQVIGLDFMSASFVLSGRVPSELGLLSHLISIDFSGKQITALPRHIPAALPSLKYLDLRGNLLGAIDPEWGAWTNLDTVNLSGNRLEGPLPASSLAQWTKIRNFDIQNTAASGNFWQDILPHWPLIETLDLTSSQQLSGSIPEVTQDGPLSRLVSLYASRTSMTGTLPASLSLATGLQVLQFSDIANFTPTELPSEFGRLTQLELLGLSSPTLLSGTLPTEIGQLTLLREFNVYSNTGLNGTIPTEMGHLEQLAVFKVCYTSLSGTVPSEIGRLVHLEDVQLHKTNLVGTVPPGLCYGVLEIMTADCGTLREGAVPQIECAAGCCECYA